MKQNVSDSAFVNHRDKGTVSLNTPCSSLVCLLLNSSFFSLTILYILQLLFYSHKGVYILAEFGLFEFEQNHSKTLHESRMIWLWGLNMNADPGFFKRVLESSDGKPDTPREKYLEYHNWSMWQKLAGTDLTFKGQEIWENKSNKSMYVNNSKTMIFF